MKNVTIKDIAKVAGVSYATVSRALSGSSEIGAETRERMAIAYTDALSAHFLAHLGEKQARALDEILGDLLESAGPADG